MERCEKKKNNKKKNKKKKKTMHYQPLLYISNGKKMTMLKNTVNLSKIIFHHYNSSCTSSICMEHVCKVLKRNTESPRRT